MERTTAALVVVERAGLVEDLGRDAQLADVVQPRGQLQLDQLDGVEAELAADVARQCGHALAVPLGVLVGGLQGRRAAPRR